MTETLDVAFLPVEVPGAPGGTGAVETSRLLIDKVSQHHDVTVYVASQISATDADLPATDRVEYVLRTDLPKLPHPLWQKLWTLREERHRLEGHDLVHSYSSAFVPLLADLDVPTISTLNSYLAACPKADMLYHGTEKCSGPAPLKCAGCLASTARTRWRGLESEVRAGYVAAGQIPYVRRALSRAEEIDAFHALSPHLRADYNALGVPGDRTRVVPHFYDDRFLASEDQPHLSDPAELFYAGALREIKGVQVLIRGLDHLLDRGVEVTLRVAGSGPDGAWLRELARSRGIDDRIEWLGHLEGSALREAYRRADLFVYPGLIDEPFGRVLLEALASQTPIVTADVGSTDYIVGSAGVQFPAGNADALASAVSVALTDYERYYEAIPGQLEQFEPQTVVSELLDLYDAVTTGELAAGPAEDRHHRNR